MEQNKATTRGRGRGRGRVRGTASRFAVYPQISIPSNKSQTKTIQQIISGRIPPNLKTPINIKKEARNTKKRSKPSQQHSKFIPIDSKNTNNNTITCAAINYSQKPLFSF